MKRELFMEEKHLRRLIAAMFIVYLVLAAFLPAADDEFYYWCWTKDLQWSYYDHPPMTAVLMRLSTMIFGDTVFGFRVPACFASAFVLYVIARLTSFQPFIWALLLSPLFTIGAVMMTPDSPLIMCWAAYLWWLVELHRRLTPSGSECPEELSSMRFTESAAAKVSANEIDPQVSITGQLHEVSLRWWLIGGVILGCGVLSKYTMAVAVPACFFSLIMSRQSWRKWLAGYVLHGIIAFFVASPILIYNIGQGFEPLLFQWKHAAEKTPNGMLSAAEFVGIQMLLFGTMPIVLFPWVCQRFLKLCQQPRLRACTCLYLLPLVFFLYKSTQTRVQGNWALICFISFWPLASEWYETGARIKNVAVADRRILSSPGHLRAGDYGSPDLSAGRRPDPR